MSINYTHLQKRRNCGKKCNFSNSGPHLLVDIHPDVELKSCFIPVASSEKETQCSSDMSLHEV